MIRSKIGRLFGNRDIGQKVSAQEVSKLAPTRDERLFLVLSIFIGIMSGLLVVAFRIAIDWIRLLALGSAPHAGQLRLIFIPAIAGLVVAGMASIWFDDPARLATASPNA